MGVLSVITITSGVEKTPLQNLEGRWKKSKILIMLHTLFRGHYYRRGPCSVPWQSVWVLWLKKKMELRQVFSYYDGSVMLLGNGI
jgi:hypothetical protein